MSTRWRQIAVLAIILTASEVVLARAQAAQGNNARYTRPATNPTLDSVCAPQEHSEDIDIRWFWRLRAYQHLDCVNGIVDRALTSTSNDRVEISRDDLERIRAEAWYARDATARIGL